MYLAYDANLARLEDLHRQAAEFRYPRTGTPPSAGARSSLSTRALAVLGRAAFGARWGSRDGGAPRSAR
jgi:hypothetical protein